MTTKFFRKNTFPSPWGRVREGFAFLFLLLWPFVLSAQNGVKVENLSMNAGTVTFDVSWDKNTMPMDVWSDTVWVFVDYNDAGVMKRLPLSPGATLTETSAPDVGKVVEEGDNDKGVWVVGNARSAGSFSATVQLHTATAVAAGACAYASNYPPVGKYTSDDNISFTGTPVYNIVIEDAGGNKEIRESGASFTVPPGYTAHSFSDRTGAPGIIHCWPPALPIVVDATFCFGLPGQLQAAASGGATIAWYDAPTAGHLLYVGNVLPLTPVYSDATSYYAEAVSERNCPSARVQANYTVNHCVINGYCPGFVAGGVGSATASVPEAACSSYDAGLIGLAGYQAACNVFYSGQIGLERSPVACVSYDAGHIGRSQ
ncbi:MAG: hypothetical protein LBF69_02115 [Prevotellaceae bacterium]|jgi:hypothetical protein|nr:hypothetical protein [Prevotellaceae bacterium]